MEEKDLLSPLLTICPSLSIGHQPSSNHSTGGGWVLSFGTWELPDWIKAAVHLAQCPVSRAGEDGAGAWPEYAALWLFWASRQSIVGHCSQVG